MDLTGQKIHRWCVVGKDHTHIKRDFWECVCDCGTARSVSGKSLRTNRSRSCGCLNWEENSQRLIKDLTGQRFGKLVAIRQIEIVPGAGARWECECDCGTKCAVMTRELRAKKRPTRSCGCLGSSRVELVGKSFGDLTVVSQHPEKRSWWFCECVCGKQKYFPQGDLLSGKRRGCGCYKKGGMREVKKDLTGQRFGKLTVSHRVPKPSHLKGRQVYWLCKCDCGGEVIYVATVISKRESCGCHKASPLTKQVLEKAISEGLRHQDIADMFQVSPNSVKWQLHKHGLRTRTCLSDVVDPEELRELYWDQGLFQHEIAEQTGFSQSSVHRMVDKHSMEKPRWHQPGLPPLEGELLSVFLGSMLGDGSLVWGSGGKTPYYSEAHTIAQMPYLEWKKDLWGPWVANWSPDAPHSTDPQRRIATMNTYRNGEFFQWEALFYPPNENRTRNELPLLSSGNGRRRKQFPEEIVSLVDELALAVWYMDDGCGNGWWPTIASAGSDEHVRVGGKILEKFGLTCKRYDVGKEDPGRGYYTIAGKKNASRFLDIIRPYILRIPCMEYKLTPVFLGGDNPVELICPVCKRSFVRDSKRIEKNKQKGVVSFCGRECAIKSRAKKVEINGVTYPSYNEAMRKTGLSFYTVRRIAEKREA